MVIRQDSPSFLYLVSLGFVTGAMLILPVLYVALAAAACYGVYAFAANNFLAIWQWPLGFNKFALLIKVFCSFTPLLVGGIVALFMVKPFLPGARKRCNPSPSMARASHESINSCTTFAQPLALPPRGGSISVAT